MALEVYWGSGSPYAWRVLLALEIKGLDYQSIRLGFSDQDLKSADFLAINPRGKVPAIRDGSFVLRESVAILRYIEDLRAEPVLFGGDAAERALIWCSLMECVNYIEPAMRDYARVIFTGQLAEKREEAIRCREKLEQEFSTIAQALSVADYLIGKRLSAADIMLYPCLKFILRAAVRENTEAVSGSLRQFEAHYPALNAWCKRIENIPNYDRTYPPHWRETT